MWVAWPSTARISAHFNATRDFGLVGTTLILPCSRVASGPAQRRGWTLLPQERRSAFWRAVATSPANREHSKASQRRRRCVRDRCQRPLGPSAALRTKGMVFAGVRPMPTCPTMFLVHWPASAWCSMTSARCARTAQSGAPDPRWPPETSECYRAYEHRHPCRFSRTSSFRRTTPVASPWTIASSAGAATKRDSPPYRTSYADCRARRVHFPLVGRIHDDTEARFRGHSERATVPEDLR